MGRLRIALRQDLAQIRTGLRDAVDDFIQQDRGIGQQTAVTGSATKPTAVSSAVVQQPPRPGWGWGGYAAGR